MSSAAPVVHTSGHGLNFGERPILVFWEVTRAGNVYAYGDAGYQGPNAALDPNAPIQTVTSDPATGGYWLIGADGGVYAYGAGFYGAG